MFKIRKLDYDIKMILLRGKQGFDTCKLRKACLVIHVDNVVNSNTVKPVI